MGVDITARLGRRTYGFQCKYKSNPDSKVNNRAVQEVYAGIRHYGCEVGVVLTNSTFTRSAREQAESDGVELWENSEIGASRPPENFIVRGIGLLYLLLGAVGFLSSFVSGRPEAVSLPSVRAAGLLVTGLLCLCARRRYRRTLLCLAGSLFVLCLTAAAALTRGDSSLTRAAVLDLVCTLILLAFTLVRAAREQREGSGESGPVRGRPDCHKNSGTG